MNSKQPAKKGHAQGKENWKRKRGNHQSSEGSSQPRSFKKSRRSPPEPEQNDSAHSSKPSSSTTATEPAKPSIPSFDITTTDTTSINIISSTQIQKKVTQTLDLLSEYPIIPPAKPKVVILHAKAPVASKLITIAEITKREIAKNGGKWLQYNKIEEVMVERKENSKKDGEKEPEKKLGGENERDDEEDEEETTAFETMKTPFERKIEGKPKLRAVPVITLYLSRVRIEGLRKAYGEQTNATEVK